MLVEPARPRSWRSGSSCPSSGEGVTSPTELRGAANTHRSSSSGGGSPRPTPPSDRAEQSGRSLREGCGVFDFKTALFPLGARQSEFTSRPVEPWKPCMASRTHVSRFPRMHRTLGLQVSYFPFLPPQMVRLPPARSPGAFLRGTATDVWRKVAE